jgi:hypothetical protein
VPRAEAALQQGKKFLVVERPDLVQRCVGAGEHHRIALAQRQQRHRAFAGKALPGDIVMRCRHADIAQHGMLPVVAQLAGSGIDSALGECGELEMRRIASADFYMFSR